MTDTATTDAPEDTISLFDSLDFAENTPAHSFTKAINASQLEEELLAAGAHRVVIQYPPDYEGEEITEANPVTVYVVGGTKKKITDALDAHVPADPA